MAETQRELQLLPTTCSSSASFSAWRRSDASGSSSKPAVGHFDGSSSVDLQLSISLKPLRSPPSLDCVMVGSTRRYSSTAPNGDLNFIEALKWQTAEQIRLANLEKAYAERVRESTRREMEMAQSEFARARHMWERAKEELEKAERLKERSTRQNGSTCMEITCPSCHQRFRRP